MRMTRFGFARVFLLALAAAAPGFPAEPFADGTFALVDLTLIDGTGSAPVPRAVVLVKNGSVEDAGSEDDVPVPRGYARVSLHGSYLLPGFINAHVHGAYNEARLRAWLAAGVTSVRDLGPQGSFDFIEERDRLNRADGNARIIAATTLITWPGGYGSAYVDSPAAARKAVQDFVRRGADVVKIAIGDDLAHMVVEPLTDAEAENTRVFFRAGGKIPDFLVVAGNPVEDIRFLEKPVLVFKSGRPVLR